MILLIDNYDSFSYNLYQLIGEIEPDIRVIRNDEMTVEEIRALKPDRRQNLTMFALSLKKPDRSTGTV